METSAAPADGATAPDDGATAPAEGAAATQTATRRHQDGHKPAKYTGEFSDGKLRDGSGRLQWPNGDFYEGMFKDGLRR